MFKPTHFPQCPPWIAILAVICGFAFGACRDAKAETILLRSGNAPIGNYEPQISLLVGAMLEPLSVDPFTPDHFADACGQQMAYIIHPHPYWLPHLTCDPEAKWIGVDSYNRPRSSLYCQEFTVVTDCIESATLSFCWACDDVLGDGSFGGPNLAGVHINGVAVTPLISGGSYQAQSVAGPYDIKPLLHPGANQLQIYNRDVGGVTSGIIYSATIDIAQCTVPTEAMSFGAIKSLYR